MPRYRVAFFTDPDDNDPGPTGHVFTADTFIIDEDSLLFLNSVDADTSQVVGAVASGIWRTVEKFADSLPESTARTVFDGITEQLDMPPAAQGDGGVPITHLLADPNANPEDEDDQ